MNDADFAIFLSRNPYGPREGTEPDTEYLKRATGITLPTDPVAREGLQFFLDRDYDAYQDIGGL